jgi:SnoaL-like polyketide cyclase
MSKEDDNKAVVGRWFTEFWGKKPNLAVIDEIAAPDMLLHYSLHEPRRGRADIKAFMTNFRKAFPDLNFWGTADLIAESDYVVGAAFRRARPAAMAMWHAISVCPRPSVP